MSNTKTNLRSFLALLQMTLLLATSVQAVTVAYTTLGGTSTTVQLAVGSNVAALLAHIRGDTIPPHIGALVSNHRALVPPALLNPHEILIEGTTYTFINTNHIETLKALLVVGVERYQRPRHYKVEVLAEIDRINFAPVQRNQDLYWHLPATLPLDMHATLSLITPMAYERDPVNTRLSLHLYHRANQIGDMAEFTDPAEVETLRIILLYLGVVGL